MLNRYSIVLLLFLLPFNGISQTKTVPAKSSFGADAPDNIESGKSHEFGYQPADEYVNKLTGASQYHIRLFDISTKSGLHFGVDLNYNGQIDKEISAYNGSIPTSCVGVGWKLGVSSIFISTPGNVKMDMRDHNGHDIYKHNYYFIENGGVSEILRNGTNISNFTYNIKSHPNWKITPVYYTHKWDWPLPPGTTCGSQNTDPDCVPPYCDNNDPIVNHYTYNTIITGWIVVAENGTVCNYGDVAPHDCYCEQPGNDATRYIPCKNDNSLFPIPIEGVQGANRLNALSYQQQLIPVRDGWDHNQVPEFYTARSKFFYQFDLKSIRDVNGGNINFNYDQNNILYDNSNSQNVYTRESYVKKIESDRGDQITFTYIAKTDGEYHRPFVPNGNGYDWVPYWDISETKYLSNVRFLNGNTLIDQINFNYSLDAGETQPLIGKIHNPPYDPPLNYNFQYGWAKRFLTGITSTQSDGTINRRFIYSQDLDAGYLTKIIEPLTGKTVRYTYKQQSSTHSIEDPDVCSSSLTSDLPTGRQTISATVVDSLIIKSGVPGTNDLSTVFTYTTDEAKQFFDLSFVPYWGEVTTNSGTGDIVTEYNLIRTKQHDIDSLFGIVKKITLKNKNGIVVASKENTYSTFKHQFGDPIYGTCTLYNTKWYEPQLISNTNTTDGVSSPVTYDWDATFQNELPFAKISANNDGSILREETEYAAKTYTAMKNLNMLTQVSGTKLISVSDNKVQKANHTVWSNESGVWRPKANYAWQSPDAFGNPVTFQNFIESNPKANGWKLMGTIDKYDNFGNVVQSSDALGISSATLYGTPLYLPVATVTNAKLGDCLFTDFTTNDIADLQCTGGMTTVANEHLFSARGLKLVGNAGTADQFARSLPTVLDANLTLSGKSFRIDFWARSNLSSTKSFVHLQAENSGALSSVSEFVLTQKWQKYSIEVTFPSNCIDKNYRIVLRPPTTSPWNFVSGYAYYDDVRVYPKSAQMQTTYYDLKWRKPTITIDANNNPGKRLSYDQYGRESVVYKVVPNNSDVLITKKEYGLMGNNLRVLTPNGGERLRPGSTYIISWLPGNNDLGMNGIDVVYYDGSTPHTIATAPAGQNYLSWTVPTTTIASGKVMISSHDNTSISDTSDERFVSTNDFVVTSPKGVYNRDGNSNSITWNQANGTVSNVRIDYFAWGTTWIPVGTCAANLKSFSFSYPYYVDNEKLSNPYWTGKEYLFPFDRVRISDTATNVPLGESDFIYFARDFQ